MPIFKKVLLGVDNQTSVNISIDPFFFSVTEAVFPFPGPLPNPVPPLPGNLAVHPIPDPIQPPAGPADPAKTRD